MNLARISGGFYLITFIAGMTALLSDGRLAFAANLVATASYLAVTVLFYYLFKPVNRRLSLLAVVIGCAGLVYGALSMFRLAPYRISPLVFFGFYCLLIGYLIVVSGFLPRALGALLACGGVGWLTFASPALARALSPYNFGPGILAEGVLTVWLLAFGASPSWRRT